MNLVSAVCPSCGAQIQIPPDQDRAFCSYCGNQIVVKTEIADKVKIDGVVKTQSADFIIEAGALKEYHGAGTDVVIPDNVTSISGAFKETPISSIKLPDGLKKISDSFRNCNSLESIALPEEVREVVLSFQRCTSLKSVTLPRGLKNLIASFDNSAVEHVKIPGSVDMIGDDSYGGCFSRCNSLKEVLLEEGISHIGESCFSHCSSLEAITIPSSVVKISSHAFFECERLSSVTILGSNIELGICTFANCPSLTTVNAPERVLESIFSFSGIGEHAPFYNTPWYYPEREKTRRAQGVCEYCGGSFKGMFLIKCSRCGKPKNY